LAGPRRRELEAGAREPTRDADAAPEVRGDGTIGGHSGRAPEHEVGEELG
jgi:hypothetical protein